MYEYDGTNFSRGDESISQSCAENGATEEVLPIGYGRVTSQVSVDTTVDSTMGEMAEEVCCSVGSPSVTTCGEQSLEEDSEDSDEVVQSQDTLYTFVCAKRVESVRCISDGTSMG